MEHLPSEYKLIDRLHKISWIVVLLLLVFFPVNVWMRGEIIYKSLNLNYLGQLLIMSSMFIVFSLTYLHSYMLVCSKGRCDSRLRHVVGLYFVALIPAMGLWGFVNFPAWYLMLKKVELPIELNSFIIVNLISLWVSRQTLTKARILAKKNVRLMDNHIVPSSKAGIVKPHLILLVSIIVPYCFLAFLPICLYVKDEVKRRLFIILAFLSHIPLSYVLGDIEDFYGRGLLYASYYLINFSVMGILSINLKKKLVADLA